MMTDRIQSQNQFRLSKFGIKIRLVSIFSILMLAATGGMIFFANIFFSDESELRIQENNLDLAQASAQWIESELTNFRNQSELMAKRLLKGSARASEFFQGNHGFIYLGVSQNNGKSFPKAIHNKGLMKSMELTKGDIKDLKNVNQRYIKGSVQGQLTAFNASKGKHVLMGISQKVGKATFLLYIDPSRIQKYFKSRKYINIYMVNQDGDVIVHPDSRTVLSNTSFAQEPIVKQMWKSPVLAGQGRFVDAADGQTYLASYRKLNLTSLGLITQTQESIVFEPVRRIRNRNLMIMGIFMFISIGVIYFFSKFMSDPIISLVDATHQVEEGHYDIEISSKSNDEIGLLTHSFQHMANGLGEREKIKDAFGRFVNKELAEKVLKGDVNLGGEQTFAAVLFVDIRSFTSMSEKMEPKDVVHFLNEYFTDLVHCIDQTNGIVDKYIGDAIMAHWGALGSSKGNETKNAIDTALLIRKSIMEFNQKNEGKHSKVYVGCGVHSGEVISGQIGSEDRLEYTVIGDTVNMASRLEYLNKNFSTDILISKSSYETVKDIFHAESLSSIKIRGKAESQTIYAVLGRKDDPNCPQNLEEMRTLLGLKVGQFSANIEEGKV